MINFRVLKSNTESGFTLIETLAVILIFSVIILIISALFIASLDIQRKAFAIQQASEEANFVLESMTKEIRVSRINNNDTNCPSSPASSLTIDHPVNGRVIYSLSGNAVHRNVNGTDSIISSNKVRFTRLLFCISGNAVTGRDYKQPKVTIVASVESAGFSNELGKTPGLRRQTLVYSIDFQTTVSQRELSN